MRIINCIIPALFISILATAPASALPSSPTKSLAVETPIVLAQYHAKHNDRPNYRPSRPHFTPGGRYKSAPHGWRRYGARPGDWRTRGCVLVGPIWFCP